MQFCVVALWRCYIIYTQPQEDRNIPLPHRTPFGIGNRVAITLLDVENEQHVPEQA